MNKRKIRLVLILILVFSLSNLAACKNEKEEQTTKDPNITSEIQIKNSKRDRGELQLDSVVLTVGESEVTYREILIYLRYLKNQYEPDLGTKIWSYQLEENKTMGDYAKEELLNEVTLVKIVVEEAKKLGIELTKDEKDEILLLVRDYLGSISEEDKLKYGIDEATLNTVLSDNYLVQKVFDMTTNEVNTNISDEEAKQIRFMELVILTNGVDKNGKTISMTQEEKIVAHQRAEKLRKEAKKVGNFKSFAEANSDLEVAEITCGRGELEASKENTLFALKQGELSTVIEGQDGYHILYLVSEFDEDATAEKKEEIIENSQNELFAAAYSKWSKDYEVVVATFLWAQIKIEE